ncbi:MAG: hypothetical protein FWE53_05385, partial [Firmicutes bacterium]|nr:hypothetical protein [Bacillota bacterium]
MANLKGKQAGASKIIALTLVLLAVSVLMFTGSRLLSANGSSGELITSVAAASSPGDSKDSVTVPGTAGAATVSIPGGGWTYGNTPPSTPTPNITTGNYATHLIVYQYRLNTTPAPPWLAWSTISSTTNAGDYFVRAIFAPTPTHAEVIATADFKILKANGSGSPTVSLTPSTWAFGGTGTPSVNVQRSPEQTNSNAIFE